MDYQRGRRLGTDLGGAPQFLVVDGRTAGGRMNIMI